MTVVSVAERMTAEEFLALPMPQRDRPLNLVEGEVVVNQATALHSAAVGNLRYALEVWARARTGRGGIHEPLAVQIDERNVYAPDILWYADGRVPGRYDEPPYPVPDLAVEVRSPSTWRYDIGAKKAGYERRGLPELWLLDTQADAVLAFRRSSPDSPAFDVALEFAREERLTSPLLPGFSLALAELFPSR
jgi:Uma2 family endonuclease